MTTIHFFMTNFTLPSLASILLYLLDWNLLPLLTRLRFCGWGTLPVVESLGIYPTASVLKHCFSLRRQPLLKFTTYSSRIIYTYCSIHSFRIYFYPNDGILHCSVLFLIKQNKLKICFFLICNKATSFVLKGEEYSIISMCQNLFI